MVRCEQVRKSDNSHLNCWKKNLQVLVLLKKTKIGDKNEYRCFKSKDNVDSSGRTMIKVPKINKKGINH